MLVDTEWGQFEVPDSAPATPDFAVQPAPDQGLAVQPAPEQGLAVQPAPTVTSGMVVDRGMGPNADDPYNGMGPPDIAVTPAIGGQDFAPVRGFCEHNRQKAICKVSEP